MESIHDPIALRKNLAPLKNLLMESCSLYLTSVKRKKNAFDPVAHFHLKNGAYIFRLNWLGNLSKKGINESFGIMVNYFYDQSKLGEYSSGYLTNNRVAVSANDPSLSSIPATMDRVIPV